MALTLGAGKKGQDWRRSDMFLVDPTKILVREDLRGRRYPPSDEAILRRAVSFYRYGQIQPCEVRLITHADVKNVPVLNSGFTRTAAARLLRDGFVVPDGFEEEVVTEAGESHIPPVQAGQFIQRADFQLQVRHVKCNDTDALVRNIVENNDRDDTSDIDDAHNHERLRRDCGWTNAEIARLYNYGSGGQNKVSRLSRLLELPEPIQLRIHLGDIPRKLGSTCWTPASRKPNGKTCSPVPRTPTARLSVPSCVTLCVTTSLPTSRQPPKPPTPPRMAPAR